MRCTTKFFVWGAYDACLIDVDDLGGNCILTLCTFGGNKKDLRRLFQDASVAMLLSSTYWSGHICTITLIFPDFVSQSTRGQRNELTFSLNIGVGPVIVVFAYQYLVPLRCNKILCSKNPSLSLP